MKYDYLVVGCGLYGAVFACEAGKKGKKCLCIDKREHLGGNIYTQEELGIQVHKYGAHIFHTSDKEVWDYINGFAEFNHYINSPIAVYKDELYNLPFNMNTFSKLWGIRTPAEAKAQIEAQKREFVEALKGLQSQEAAEVSIESQFQGTSEVRIESQSHGAAETFIPSNLEEQAISLVGRDIYTKLVKGYTEKQWGRDCKELPAFIIKRLPVRFTYDNNYFTDPYQGIPKGGYTQIIEKMLENCQVLTGVEYRDFLQQNAGKDQPDTFCKTVYTGPIDEYYEYRLGALQYRSLRFEEEVLPQEDNFQGNAVVNYTEREVPYTRIIEHKHFEFLQNKGTVITREYPADWQPGMEPYYPINDEANNTLYEQYEALAKKEKDVIFGGRLGQYKYYDMDKVIRAALDTVRQELG